jgi:hypothetical protein
MTFFDKLALALLLWGVSCFIFGLFKMIENETAWGSSIDKIAIAMLGGSTVIWVLT